MTVLSWDADFYLTGNIYVLKQDVVFRYPNRNPENDLATRDHRLETIKNHDVRASVGYGSSVIDYVSVFFIILRIFISLKSFL